MKRQVSDRRILVVDDEESNLVVLKKILLDAGFTEVRALQDSRRALPQIREFQPDILLLDLNMPHLDGFGVMRQVRDRLDPIEYFPILVISGELAAETKQRALGEGASDFLAKPYDKVEAVLRVRNLLATRDLNRRLEDMVRERTEQVRVTQLAVADRLALAAELRDYGRGLHTHRVGRTAAAIAMGLGLPDDEVQLIRRAAPLHDLGKIGIADSILLKPGELTLEEWDILKTHTTLGAAILSGSDSRVLQVAEEIALYHHENWDGTGYTPGLAGEEIPLPGRITALADVLDALIHDRPYKKAWSEEEAVEWISEQSGQKFDPAVVDAFLRTRALEELPLLDESADDDERPDLAALLAPFAKSFPNRPE